MGVRGFGGWCAVLRVGQPIAMASSSSSPSEFCWTADASQPGQLCRLSCMNRSQSKQNKCLHPEHCKTTPRSCSSLSGKDRLVEHPWQQRSAEAGSFGSVLLGSCTHIYCSAGSHLARWSHAYCSKYARRAQQADSLTAVAFRLH